MSYTTKTRTPAEEKARLRAYIAVIYGFGVLMFIVMFVFLFAINNALQASANIDYALINRMSDNFVFFGISGAVVFIIGLGFISEYTSKRDSWKEAEAEAARNRELDMEQEELIALQPID